MASWPTPTTRDHKDGTSEGTAPVNALLGRTAWLAGWQTPKLPSGGGQENRQTEGGGLRKLEDQVILAGWGTPKISSGDYQTGRDGERILNLQGQTRLTQWPAIPDAMDAAKLLGLEAELAQLMATGVTQVGFYADQNGPAVIPLGGPLNAGLSRWLMSLPQIWDTSSLTALGSLPRSRKKPK